MAVKIDIDNKRFNWEDGTVEKAAQLMKNIGAQEISRQEVNENYVIKNLSAIDPYTIGLGIATGLGTIAWIIYRVTQQQKETLKNNFEGRLN